MAKILLVEDDKSLREIYGVRLMAEGYEIVSAGDGEEALAIAIKEAPALIVSDVMMPKISGFDMLDILRSTTETKDIKVIMMTALSSDDQRARGEALGADRYLVKSQVGIEDVVRTVHDVLGDGVAGSAPAAPSFSSTPAQPGNPSAPVMPAPVAAPAPMAPMPAMPAPLPNPVAMPAPVTSDPVAPAPVEAPLPPVINIPTEEPVMAPPAPIPAPTPEFVMPEPAMPAPVEMPAPIAPTPAAPAPFVAPAPSPFALPEPTAPFSSPAPASLGDRIIAPLNPNLQVGAPNDIATQMNQELAAQMAPLPPAPAPEPPLPPQPPVPPMPPQPGAAL
ncbi:MAG: response regulator [Candidatus Saccharimonadales bacterium]